MQVCASYICCPILMVSPFELACCQLRLRVCKRSELFESIGRPSTHGLLVAMFSLDIPCRSRLVWSLASISQRTVY